VETTNNKLASALYLCFIFYNLIIFLPTISPPVTRMATPSPGLYKKRYAPKPIIAREPMMMFSALSIRYGTTKEGLFCEHTAIQCQNRV